MAALTHWASNDGATWGDRRRSRGASFLSGGGSARLFTGAYYPVIQHTVVVDGALPATTTEPKDEVKTRRRETIFGPDVGDDDQPGWTSQTDGNAVSVDVIKRWVEKAKSEEGLHSTTTLQALVNLKRPTLLLQPMEPAGEADVSTANGHHARPLHLLKFNYDSMTPLVKVTLTQYPNTNVSSTNAAQPEPRVLYTGVHPGGFNQAFALPADAAIDLSSAIAPIPPPEEAIEDDVKDVKDRRASEETTGTSGERADGPAGSELQAIPELNQEQQEGQQQRSGRRFGLFNRRRETDVEQGNIEMTPTTGAANGAAAGNGDAAAATERDAEKEEEEKKKREEEHGMRLVIQLDALGPDGEPLRRRNGQLTHILVSGTWQPDAGSTATSGTGKRVWVVKVVRREAQIGAHSFLLKEIYGLSSAAGSDATSYPPSASDPYASTPNECIVCLTSPRDVVLLPCRHLVVCRECAVGMVEFGAGGRVARRDDGDVGAETNGTPATGAAPGEVPPLGGTGVGGALSGTTPAPPPPPPTRRKKKAKGWYCPVCRQPYTSLLRLALPPSKAGSSGTATPAGGVTTDVGGGAAPSLRRAASVRSVRTTHSVATLPDGAEAMLSRLGPQGDDDDDDDEEDDEHYDARMREQYQHDHGHDMPQFVVAEATTNPPPPASHTAPGPPAASPSTAAPVAAESPGGPQPDAQPASSPSAPPAAMTTTSTNPASVTNGVANMRVAE